jgi:DNA-binding response OmpR family regulator
VNGPANPMLSNRTVLIVEDDPLFRKVLTTVLSSLGVHPLVVDSGEAALEAAKSQQVDMVLMDYHLPGMNGLDLARSLRESNIASPMILISGFLTESMKVEAQEARIAKVLHKPMDMSVLQNSVVGLLEKADIGRTSRGL